MAGLITGLDAGRVRARRRARARARSRRPRSAPAATRPTSSCSPRSSTSPLEELGVLAEAGLDAARREPRAGARGQGRRATRATFTLALHRPAPEPQGQADPPARRADPLGRVGLRARAARAPRRRRRPRSSSRSTSPARRARPASRRPSCPRSSSAAPVPVAGLMTMPPFAEDPEDEPPRTSPRCASSRPRTACAQLSMGTSQDYAVAVEEGATIVRVGSTLVPTRPAAP